MTKTPTTTSLLIAAPAPRCEADFRHTALPQTQFHEINIVPLATNELPGTFFQALVACDSPPLILLDARQLRLNQTIRFLKHTDSTCILRHPVPCNTKSAKSLRKELRRLSSHVFCSQCLSFHRGVNALKEALDSGVFGEITRITIYRTPSLPYALNLSLPHDAPYALLEKHRLDCELLAWLLAGHSFRLSDSPDHCRLRAPDTILWQLRNHDQHIVEAEALTQPHPDHEHYLELSITCTQGILTFDGPLFPTPHANQGRITRRHNHHGSKHHSLEIHDPFLTELTAATTQSIRLLNNCMTQSPGCDSLTLAKSLHNIHTRSAETSRD